MCRGMFTVRKNSGAENGKDFGLCFGGAPHIFFPGNSYRLAESPKYRSSEGYQCDWRECYNCQCIYFDRKANELAFSGACFNNGPHFPHHSKLYKNEKIVGVLLPVNYRLQHFSEDIAPGYFTWWRWCRKCEMLFYPKGGESGIFCPAGGNHDASESGYYRPEEAEFYF